jgi:hypothetical protein
MPDPAPDQCQQPTSDGADDLKRPSIPQGKQSQPFSKLMAQVVFISLWLFWGCSVLKILVTSIQANQGQPESYLAITAFLPAVFFTLLNGYWVRHKTSTLPLPALTVWIAGLTSHGQSTIGPTIGLFCFLLDPINPFTFAAIRFVLPRFRRSKPESACSHQ